MVLKIAVKISKGSCLPTFMEKCDICIALRPVFSVEMS